eukprot:gnl/MRDRNA2_/MRDRNA2_95309_c0_seq1.p1 gnl/MRDRNA2_/MRDRNA2_95309_c0~~gnl/MRDRNA2_/MRDRNA2_95309_c0_seq1.p1  ORF type:complete len:737 (-),score=163.43 gnl/MRDRNA2_/MRDRNA2_95309_c0_seq1:70-2157(-)
MDGDAGMPMVTAPAIRPVRFAYGSGHAGSGETAGLYSKTNPLTGTGLPPGLLPNAILQGCVPLTGPTAFRPDDPPPPPAPALPPGTGSVSASAAYLPGGSGFGVAPGANAQPPPQNAFQTAATNVALSEAAPKVMPKPPVVPPKAGRPSVPVFGDADANKESKEPQITTEQQQKEAEEAAKRTAKLKEMWDHQRTLEGKEGYFEQTEGYAITGGASGSYTLVDSKCLGVGMFASVYRCKINETDPSVAIKVIRHQEFFRKFADREVETLLKIRECSSQDVQGASFCCRLNEHFIHKVGEKEHLCLVFEELGRNMRDLGRVPLREAILYGHQLLCSLRFLHDQCQLAHCDVKPDNLLLAKDGLTIRLCDFGTARTAQRLAETDEIQPMFYRAPELILGAPRNALIDTWGAGCTLYEFCCGQILCRGCLTLHEVLERLMTLRGPPSKLSLKKGRRASSFFFANTGGIYFKTPVGATLKMDQYKKETLQTVILPHIDFGDMQAPTDHEQATAKMRKILGSVPAFEGQRTQSMKKKQVAGSRTEGEKKMQQITDLLENLLEMDPAQRMTAKAASEHKIFKEFKKQIGDVAPDSEQAPDEKKDDTIEEKKEETKEETQEVKQEKVEEDVEKAGEEKQETKETKEENKDEEMKEEKIDTDLQSSIMARILAQVNKVKTETATTEAVTKEEPADVKMEESVN